MEDVDAGWQQVVDEQLGERFDVRLEPPRDQRWGIRDFVIFDPSGVLWRIAQNTERMAE